VAGGTTSAEGPRAQVVRPATVERQAQAAPTLAQTRLRVSLRPMRAVAGAPEPEERPEQGEPWPAHRRSQFPLRELGRQPGQLRRRTFLMSGITSDTDTYDGVTTKANIVVGAFVDLLQANSFRMPINEPTALDPWWNSYKAAIDVGIAKGMK